jgi:hypothetical protein
MKIQLLTVEGTPAEIAAVPQLQQLLANAEGVVRVDNGGGAERDATSQRRDATSQEVGPVTAELIRRAIMRKPLSAAQRAIFQTLYRANGDGWISLPQLEELPEVGRGGCPGAMGGIGLRCDSTRGWPRDAGRARDFLFEIERRDDGRWYRLKPVTRRGLELAGVQ